MLSPRKYAETLGVSHTAVMDWLKAGLLPGATMSTAAERTYYEIPEGTPPPELKIGRPKKATTKAPAKKAGKKGN